MQPPAPSTQALGAALAQRRRARGSSQENVAAEADITASYLSGIELGKRNPTWEVLTQLADALGCGIDDLAREAVRQEAIRREDSGPSSPPS